MNQVTVEHFVKVKDRLFKNTKEAIVYCEKNDINMSKHFRMTDQRSRWIEKDENGMVIECIDYDYKD